MSDKGTVINKITLVDNDKVISNDKQLCKTFSNFLLGEKCPYSELFWSVFSRIRVEYGEIAQIHENKDQKYSEYEHYSRSVFQEAVKTLRVSDSFNISNYSRSDPVNNAIRKYENHLSVKKTRETITITSNFNFSGVDKADVEKSMVI